MKTVREPSRDTPICASVDVCVVGGSATGVFAAVRAARLGARVALIENSNCFGGSATLSMVNDWHNLTDVGGGRTIIAGLTAEVIDRLVHRGVADLNVNDRTYARYNTEEMKLELDRVVSDEDRITPFLHTMFVAPIVEEGRIRAVCVENKSGRSAIAARVFIDATGDGDLAARVAVPHRWHDHPMPGTTCAKIDGMPTRDAFDLVKAIRDHREEFGFRPDYGWYGTIPGSDHVTLHFDLHVFDFDSTDAASLTAAEIRGRRQVRSVMDLVRKYAPTGTRIALIDLPARVGVRESRHFRCLHHLTGEELLTGVRFPDAIANGTYPPDLHDARTGSTHLKFLDGRELKSSYSSKVWGRWCPEGASTPDYYQIPYQSLVPAEVPNLIITGRAIDADEWAHGAIRVMVNCNQTGEAAGVAAYMACKADTSVQDVPAAALRATLAAGGSAVL